MGAIIPQIITEDRASGAPIIDGGLRFDSSKGQYLKRTLSSSGNRQTWTWSGWVKKASINRTLLLSTTSNGSEYHISTIESEPSDSRLGTYDRNVSGVDYYTYSAAKLRDHSEWYHIVMVWDTSNSTQSERIRTYINGVITVGDSGSIDLPTDTSFTTAWNNSALTHHIGMYNDNQFADAYFSQVYFIDGQALGPEYFGYTDPLTNTWRPKKFSGDFNGAVTSAEYDSNYGSGITLSEVAKTVDNDLSTFGTATGDFVGYSYSYSRINIKVKNTGVSTYDFYIQPWVSGSATNSGTFASSGGNSLQIASGATITDVFTFPSGYDGNFRLYLTNSGNSASVFEIYDVGGTPVSTNSFYLPFDGSAPIGQDQSGNGNNWTPVNFGGSNTIEKATGALPILNTDGGGKVARPGVLGSEVSKNYTLTGSSGAGNGYVFSTEGTKPTLSFHRGGTYTFDYTSATSHPLYLSSLNDGKHNAKAYSVSFDGSGDYLTVASGSDYDFGTGDFTVEWYQYWNNAPGTYESPFGINYATNPNLLVQSGNGTTAYTVYMNGTSTTITESIAGPTGEWVHYAIVRSGSDTNNIKIYRNGVVTGQGTYTGNVGNGSVTPTIAYDNNYYFDGKISNFRIVKGTAVYTSEFNPPATTLTDISGTVLLCCQDSSAGTAEVGTISSVSGNAVASNTSPFLYDTDNYFGVDTSTSNVTKMTVPHWAADTLYYYCNVHAGMGNSISVVTDTNKADPYAWRNSFALPLVSKDDVSNLLNCTTSAKTMTVAGNAALSSVQSNFYGSSYVFDGLGDYITTPGTADFRFGTGDFTIEFWAWVNSTQNGTNGGLINYGDYTGSNCWEIILTGTSQSPMDLRIDMNGTNSVLAPQDVVLTNTWQHHALVRRGGVLYYYLDGVGIASTTHTVNYSTPSNDVLRIGGRNGLTNYDMTGYMSDVRVYKGVAKYTSNFIPASTDPDIVPDTPSGIPYSSSLTQITDGSVSFTGFGTYFTLGSSTDFNVGTGDFTFECFAYSAKNNQFKGIFGSYEYSDSSILIQTTDTGVLRIVKPSGLDQYGTTVVSDRWAHLAVTRSGTTLRGFVNGIQEISTTYSSSIDFTVGGSAILAATDRISYPNLYDFVGQLSNVHFVKGTALYTSNFTPPTGPITAVENTKLLCCQSSKFPTNYAVAPTSTASADLNLDFTNTSFVDVSGNSFNPVIGGSAQRIESGDNTYGLSYAVDLNGTNQYLSIPNIGWNSNRDFTIEGFFWVDGVVHSGYLFDMRSATYTSAPYIYIDVPSGTTSFNLYSPQGTYVGSIPCDTWHHVRMTNDAVYLNGRKVLAGPGQTSISTGVIGIRYSLDSTILNGRVGGFRAFDTNLGAPTPETISTSSGVLENTVDNTIIARGKGVPATNFNPFTVDIKAKRGKQSGYATLNPLWKGTNTSNTGGTFAAGNLQHTTVGSNGNTPACANTYVSSGKWYWEVSQISGPYLVVGVAADTFSSENYPGYGTGAVNGQVSWGYISHTGSKIHNSTSAVPYGRTFDAIGTVVGVAMDLDNGELTYYVNGVSQGVAFYNLSGNLTASHGDGGSATGISYNFGQKPFKFPPPEGFQPLTLANTPRPTIVRPDQYVGIATFSGSATSSVGAGITQTISGFKFSPDLVWIKARTTTANIGGFANEGYHVIVDTVRGRDKILSSNSTGAELTNALTLPSFNYDGFDVGYEPSWDLNMSGDHYVAWCWKAGGNSNTFNIDDVGYDTASAAGLTAGTKTPTGASVNTKSGFSIIAFTGDQNAGTISHGLGKAPSFYIVKTRDSNSGGSNDWYCYHSALGASARIQLNSTAAQTTGSSQWNNTSPTSSVLSLGSGAWQETGDRFIIYAWAEIPGFSKFGSYTGGTNPKFVHCGFRPAYLLIKGNTTSNWVILDNQRDKYNTMTQKLYADTYTAENVSDPAGDSASANNVDFVSNGFVLRSTNTWTNGSSTTYIYAAFAEAPSINLYGAQANAR